MSIHYTCPYCNRDCTIDDSDIKRISNVVRISDDHGIFKGIIMVITCPNSVCRKQKISASIYKWDRQNNKSLGQLFSWDLLPESEAKVFPDYIPEQLRNDYLEACLIKNKSPKASATLSRRCLQGMIRDFWNIKKDRLGDEIKELESHIDGTTWKAIDAVRQVGNIGAHMEKDVNLIIDVEEKEAGLLIGLIETLFQEWYIRRFEREESMQALTSMAEEKRQVVKTPKSIADKGKGGEE